MELRAAVELSAAVEPSAAVDRAAAVGGVAGVACETPLQGANMHVGLWFLMYLKVNTHLVKGSVLVGFLFK